MSKMPKKQTLEHATTTHPGLAADAADHRDPGPADVDADGPVDGSVDADDAMHRSRRFKEVWLVEDRKNARSIWTRVGAAFENADGSWNIRLSAVPLGGRLNVRDPLPRERSVTA